jgi:predicted RNase H-like nuclease (RuvC/YqgF family)
MDTTNVASLIVATIAALAALASQRSASRASTLNARTAAEEEAYNRARAFDLETIKQLKEENKELREREKELEEQVDILKWRVSRMERGLPPAPYPSSEQRGDRNEEQGV